MLGSLFWYGLTGFLIILGVFSILLFLLRPLIFTYLEKNQLWYLTGFIISGLIGYSFSSLIELRVCFGIPLSLCCIWIIRFFSAVAFCIIFWVAIKPRGKEL